MTGDPGAGKARRIRPELPRTPPQILGPRAPSS